MVVSDVVTVSLPPNPAFLSLLYRVDQRLHALVVSGLRLHEVDDVEAIGLVLACVLHPEVVPLGVAIGAVVVL